MADNRNFPLNFRLVAKGLISFFCLILLWWGAVFLFDLPNYILPSPYDVGEALWDGRAYLAYHTLITLSEIILGFLLGLSFGAIMAFLLMAIPRLQNILLPIFVISQSIPIFAVAPILVLWFGFGISSKIITAVLVIFFPVTSAFFDGLKNTNLGLLELGKTMGATRYRQLTQIRLMAALPALGSGARVAAAIAPIGAIVGEWVGSSAGLGYVMLQANARLQTSLCFSALFILSALAILLYLIVDIAMKRLIYWQPTKDPNT